jgi:hypothetical protein
MVEPTAERGPKAILEVLESPHLLSAFAEFMDKEGHLSSLQFWMTASGIERQMETLEHQDGNSWLLEPDSVVIDDACKLFHNFFRKNAAFIELEDDLFRDLAACFERLDAKDPTELQSLRWLKLIRKAKDAVLSQMELEYQGFAHSSIYKTLQKSPGRHNANDLGHFPDDYSNYSGDGSPRKSNDSLCSSDGEEDRSRKPFKLTNMFKMKKKEAGGSDDMFHFPSRKDGTDNVEGELKSILNSDERVSERSFFAKRTLSRSRKDKSKESRVKDDGYLSSDNEKSSGFFKGFSRHKKSASSASKKELSPNSKSNTLDRSSPRTKEMSVSKDSLKTPLSDSDSGSENVLSTLTRSRDEMAPKSVGSDVQIVLYPHQRVLELQEKCDQLEKERKQLQNQMEVLHQDDEAEAKKYRQLSLMQVGLDVELANLRAETVRVERDDLDHILTPVITAILHIFACHTHYF